ncbi:MAG: hypothetical protein JWN39_4135 [Ilumatobacteraceae bacterium]|nr:hypothetical protein [Ilumatobacteraceae bacterium]MCU1397028.1 hypothetical protein [Acidimicrobiales bacterium]
MTTSDMSTETPRLTAWDLFFEDAATAEHSLQTALTDTGLLKTLPEGAPVLQAAAAKYLMTQVAQQVLQLLQALPMGDMLSGGWGHLQAVMQAKAATKLDGSSRHVALAAHEISFGNEPAVEMLLDEVPVPFLRFALEAAFSIQACDLEIAGGEIGHVGLGSTGVQATLRSNAITLLHCPLKQLDIGRIFAAGDGADAR